MEKIKQETITPSVLERERRRNLIIHRYLRREPVATIAADLGVTTSSVYTLLRRVRQEWLRSSIRKYDELKAVELARIDAVEEEYWQGWRNSLKNREVEEIRDFGKGKPAQSMLRSEGQAGNPAFLDGVMKCIERRCKILGIDVPSTSININIDWERLTDEQLEAIRSGIDPRRVIDVTPNDP